MKILIAASEVSPIVKIGGLGDFIGSLPKALEKIGVNADVIVPFFPTARTEDFTVYKSHDIFVPFGGGVHTVEVHKTVLPNSAVDVILLKNHDYFNSGGVGFFEKNLSETEMYAFFDRCVVEFIKSGFNTYDVVHCNDWHTGLVTHLLQDEIPDSRPATLFTIHNIMYQGLGNSETVKRVGIVPGSHPLIDWDVADGDLNMIQQGIASSDFINAVSPSYAEEILTEEYGGSLSDILLARRSRLSGILNGIDYSMFPRSFDNKNWEEGKNNAKKYIQKSLGLKDSIDSPIFSYIGRVDSNQKGISLIYDVVEEIIRSGGQFIFLGKGESKWEQKLKNLEKINNVSINISFDIQLANNIYSASNYLLIPSKYEPCGLIQMIANWYGTLPIARKTGGLKDSIKNGNNGILFDNYSVDALQDAIYKALLIYKDKDKYRKMVDSAMNMDFSWDKSAVLYKELYERILESRN